MVESSVDYGTFLAKGRQSMVGGGRNVLKFAIVLE